MAKITLNLGSVLSEILKNSNSNFTELYDAISKIQEKIADDGEKAVVYSTVDKMVEKLNAGTDENGNALDITIGDEIYILDDDTPDFWVSAVSTTSTTGTKPASWEKGTNYIFGKYTIRVSKSREIDLADYQKIVNMQTGDSLSDDSTKTKYPSSHTVYIWVTSLITNINSILSNKVDKITGKGLSTNDYTNDEKTKVADNTSARHSHSNKALLDTYDQTNANIKDAVTKKHSHSNKTVLDNTTASYTTAEKEKLAAIDDSLKNVTADQIGKVKDVKVNGTSVLGTDGVAAITLEALKADFVSVATTDSVWKTGGITVNDTLYQAIRVEKTDSALGVFNSAGQEIVVQKVVAEENGVDYLYICIGTEKVACTIRKLSGGAVGSGGSGGGVKYMHNLYITGGDDRVGNFAICAMYINDSDTLITTYVQLLSAVAIRRMPATGYCGSTNSAKPVYCLQTNSDLIRIHLVSNSGDMFCDISSYSIPEGGISDSVLQI